MKFRLKAKTLILLIVVSISQMLFFQNYDNLFENNSNSTPEEEDAQPSLIFKWNRTIDLFTESGGIDIEIDSENNIYALGYFYNETESDYNSYILKYDFEGNLHWNKTLNYSAIGFNSLAIDSSDNICIVGGNDNSDIQICKYNNSGELTWERTWGTPGSDFAYSLCFDEMDNLYVAGDTDVNEIMGDVIVLKYNSTGDFKWNKTWGLLDTDHAFDIKVDGDRNLYFTGYSFLGEICNIILVKLNSSGDLQWNKTWGASYLHIGYALTIDSSNNIFVTGFDQGVAGLHHDLFIFKVNSSGDLKWNYTYGGSGHHYGYSITVDSKENILVSGISDGDILIVKVNQTGGKEWIKTWGDEFTEVAYGIAIDKFDNIFLTGYIQQATDGDEFLLLVQFLPTPDNFELFSDAMTPDPDGNFALTWSESIDADNYSLFQSNTSITEINSSVIEIISDNTNRTYAFENFTEGTYYFMAMAFNEYGNTSSNCKQVIIQFPPDEFYLNNHTEIPDTDGILNLTWSHSEGAKYYNVYVDGSFIYDVDIDQTLVTYNVTEGFYRLENITNGDYYYVILAINDAGETMSNCIHVAVRRAPDRFNLTSDAGNPYDDDGSFELIWTRSRYAINYTVYMSNHSISALNDSAREVYNVTPSFEWPTYRYQLCHCSGTGLNNGTYYLIVKASNEYGSSMTNCLMINVAIPKEIEQASNTWNELVPFLPQILLYSSLLCLILVLIILYQKSKRT